jgi:hypothetical protein
MSVDETYDKSFHMSVAIEGVTADHKPLTVLREDQAHNRLEFNTNINSNDKLCLENLQNKTRPLPERGVRRLYSFALRLPRLHPLHPDCPLVWSRELSPEIQHQRSLLLRELTDLRKFPILNNTTFFTV